MEHKFNKKHTPKFGVGDVGHIQSTKLSTKKGYLVKQTMKKSPLSPKYIRCGESVL